jgi:rhodanese-related sulfurtransferase
MNLHCLIQDQSHTLVRMKAAEFFAARLAFQTDVSDVHAALESGNAGFVLVDTRNDHAWDQGHIPGAIRLRDLDDGDEPVVTYCWGPGCNGATKAALALAERGREVREMIGGIEYWIREGFPTRTAAGITTAAPDPLTAPSCGC